MVKQRSRQEQKVHKQAITDMLAAQAADPYLKPEAVKFCFWSPSHREILKVGLHRAQCELYELRGTSRQSKHGEAVVEQALSAIQAMLHLLKHTQEHLERMASDTIVPPFERLLGLDIAVDAEDCFRSHQKRDTGGSGMCLPKDVGRIIHGNVREVMRDPKSF